MKRAVLTRPPNSNVFCKYKSHWNEIALTYTKRELIMYGRGYRHSLARLGGEIGGLMINQTKSSFAHKDFLGMVAALLWTLTIPNFASSQTGGFIDAGTTLTVRTNEDISANASDGRLFS